MKAKNRTVAIEGTQTMNTITEKMNEQRQKQYNKAKEDLIKAKESFDKLDNTQKQQIVEDLLGIKAAAEIYKIIQNA